MNRQGSLFNVMKYIAELHDLLEGKRLIGRTIDFLARSQSFLHAGKIPLNPLIISHYKVDLLLIRHAHILRCLFVKRDP